MSLYLGRDNYNNGILHITDGITPESSMKTGVLPDTLFHSSMPYLQKRYSEDIGVIAVARSLTQFAYLINLSDTCISLINQGYYFNIVYAIGSNGYTKTILNNASYGYGSNDPSYAESVPLFRFWHHTYYMTWPAFGYPAMPNSTYRYLDLGLPGNPSHSFLNNSVTVIFYNIKNSNLEKLPTLGAKVSVSADHFTINTGEGEFNLKEFSPIRYHTIESGIGFLSNSKAVRLSAYEPPAGSISGWRLTPSGNSAYKISAKYGSLYYDLIGNTIGNLTYVGFEDVNFNLSTTINASTSTLYSIGPDELATVFFSGQSYGGGIVNLPAGGVGNFMGINSKCVIASFRSSIVPRDTVQYYYNAYTLTLIVGAGGGISLNLVNDWSSNITPLSGGFFGGTERRETQGRQRTELV